MYGGIKGISIESINKLIKFKYISIYKLSFIYFLRIEKIDYKINFFTFRYFENSLRLSRIYDSYVKYKRSNFFIGLLISVKDQILIKNIHNSACSIILSNYISSYDSEIIWRLKKNFVINLGKLNMDEFGIGFSTSTSIHGYSINSWKLNIKNPTLSGGSSGGCGTILSNICCPVSIGTDTGGSTRQPARLNGIIGLKPTYGRCSRWGIISYSSSLDQVGILSHTVYSCSLLLNLISGLDIKDWNSSNLFVPKYNFYLSKYIKGNILIPIKYTPCINESWTYSLSVINLLNIKIKEIKLNLIETVLPIYCIISAIECSTNLSRYDGIKYGLKFKENNSFILYKKLRSSAFGLEVKKKLLIGTYLMSLKRGYENYYIKAQKLRYFLKNEIIFFLKNSLALITPTVSNIIPNVLNYLKIKYETDIYTIISNITGLPSISVPICIHNEIPFGIQLIGKPFDEINILNLSYNIEYICGKFNPLLW